MNYGLIGRNISYSFSEKYFTEKFTNLNLANRYKTYDLVEINELPKILKEESLSGFNVTIPYKVEVLDFLTDYNKIAKDIQAVNCVKIVDNQLIGYNTDAIGFQKSLEPLLKDQHTSALIFGDGGAAKAVKYILEELKIPYKSVTRKGDFTFNELTKDDIKHSKLLINTTPVGTYPKIDEILEFDTGQIGPEHLVYDLIYNPEKTKLLQIAENQGATIKNGYEMLVNQAEESWKIWNS